MGTPWLPITTWSAKSLPKPIHASIEQKTSVYLDAENEASKGGQEEQETSKDLDTIQEKSKSLW